MQQVTISIVYHSGQGHTKQIAEILAENLQSGFSFVNLISVDEAVSQFDLLHQSDTIVFGCPETTARSLSRSGKMARLLKKNLFTAIKTLIKLHEFT